MDGELEQLGERIAEHAAHLEAAKHRLLTDLRAFDERGGYSKVRAMLRIATPENEPLLLGYARLMTASQLEVTCRKYALVQRHGTDPHPLDDQYRRHVRRRDTDDGMVKIEAVLHPEEAELVWTMLNHAATQHARQRGVPPAPAGGTDSAESNPTVPRTAGPGAEPLATPEAEIVAPPHATGASSQTVPTHDDQVVARPHATGASSRTVPTHDDQVVAPRAAASPSKVDVPRPEAAPATNASPALPGDSAETRVTSTASAQAASGGST